MISSLRGQVLAINAGSAVIEVGGLGFLFSATPSTLAQLKIGATAQILTTLIVREDSLTLFGFRDDDERHVFHVLLGVSGIGAKTALAALAVLSPEELRQALHTKDEKLICKVPGIGPKVAKRIILEIGDKLGIPQNSRSQGTRVNAADSPSTQVAESDLLDALVNLGWSEIAAHRAVKAALAELPQGDLTQLLRFALQILGGQK